MPPPSCCSPSAVRSNSASSFARLSWTPPSGASWCCRCRIFSARSTSFPPRITSPSKGRHRQLPSRSSPRCSRNEPRQARPSRPTKRQRCALITSSSRTLTAPEAASSARRWTARGSTSTRLRRCSKSANGSAARTPTPPRSSALPARSSRSALIILPKFRARSTRVHATARWWPDFSTR